MSYVSIFSYTDGDAASEHRLNCAAALARRFDAHLSVLGIGYDYNVPSYAFAGAGGIVMADLITQAQDDSVARTAEAEKAIERAGILGDAEPLVCQSAILSHAIAKRAQFADLVVVSRPYGDDVPVPAETVFEGAMLDGEVPVLICPPDVQPTNLADTDSIVIGWNGSREALRAVRGAMPFLRHADSVEIVMIEAAPSQPEPGRQLATMLSRHGVPCEILAQAQSVESVGTTLIRRAAELGAGLVVIGGYGHSRLREYVIGGVTREVATTCPVPVLLAH